MEKIKDLGKNYPTNSNNQQTLIAYNQNSYGPYEMLYFGKYVGHRFSWDKNRFLEIFPVTPEGVDRYATECLVQTYPQLLEKPDAAFQEAGYIIINKELIGGYLYGETHANKTLNAIVVCIASKLNKDIVLGVLSELQDIAKEKQLQNITVEFDYPAIAAPGDIPGLEALSYDIGPIVLNDFKYSITTVIPEGTRSERYDSLTADLRQRVDVDYEKIMRAFVKTNDGMSFVIRDNNTHKFLGAALITPLAQAVNICKLDVFVLDPALRGKKHGSAMLKLLERCLVAANVNNIMLTTNDYMVPGFYLKNSYKIYDKVKENNTIAYLFGKRLSNKDGTPGTEPRSASPLRLL